MRSLLRGCVRRYSFWKCRHRIVRMQEQLTALVGQPVRLRPLLRSGGGQDLICQAVSWRNSEDVLAAVRLGVSQRPGVADEPQLPRRTLSLAGRIQREASIYARLGRLGISPALMIQGDDYLANEWLPWLTLKDILRRSDRFLWELLPTVFQAIHAMHQTGVQHLDLNGGNILVRPDRRAVRLIDFEYEPVPGIAPASLRAFDYLRFTHNLLRRRRGLGQIQAAPQRYLDILRAARPDVGGAVRAELPATGMDRIRQIPGLFQGFDELLGQPPLRMGAECTRGAEAASGACPESSAGGSPRAVSQRADWSIE